ncbi:MAG: tetratricopeptide repeat protein [Limisphaerales bacterium]
MKPRGLKSFITSRGTALVCLLLAAVTSVAYWQVSGFEFTNFDEFKMVLNNPFVLGGLTLNGLSWALTTSWFEYWHPLTWLSHMLDCELFGLSPGWHHLMSLWFHVANTLLLFVVLQRMTGALWRSAMVAALFALHPLHVESVAWIAERKDVLSAFFFFLALWAYVRYVEAQSPKSKVQGLKSETRSPKPGASGRWSLCHLPSAIFYLLSLSLFACGLMSKPMVVTLPFVLLLLDYWPLRRFAPGRVYSVGAGGREPQRRDERREKSEGEGAQTDHFSVTDLQAAETGLSLRPSRLCGLTGFPSIAWLQLRTKNSELKILFPLILEKLPFFVLTVASCAITYLGVRAGGSIVSAEKVPWGLRLANVPVSYARYLGKLIWPTDLIALYPMPSHWAGWQVGWAVLVLGLISLFVALQARSAPYLIVGWLLFLGVLFPTIGIVQTGFQSIADRYTYIPSIGIFIAVVWAAAEWGEGKSRAGVSPAPASISPEASGPSAGGALGRRDTRPTLLAGVATAVLLLCGYLTWVQVGTWRNSFTLWTHCLAVCPDNVFAHYNLGYVLQHSNKASEEAMEQYRAVLHLKPDHPDANLNLGIALIGSGHAQEATNYLAAALRTKPGYARAEGAMGLALLELGDYAGAVTHCGEAIRLNPEAFGPHVDMGRALSAQGKSDDALRYYAEGLRLNPAFPQTHYYLGLEWMKRDMFDQAAASFGEAVRLAPTWAEAHAQQQRALNEANKPQMDTDQHR